MSDDEVEIIDYDQTLKEKITEEQLINERLKEASTKLDVVKKVWGTFDTDQMILFSNFLNSKLVYKESNSVRKRIVVGNTSHFIPQKFRGDDYTHKWTVYVRGSKEEPDISSFVKKARITIHPSFAPNDVIDVHHPPFHLSRRGYGEFQVIVQLHFKGNTDINKPLEIVHHLRLDKAKTGKIVNAIETIADIELDKQALAETDTFSETQEKKIKQKLSFNSDDEFADDEVVQVKAKTTKPSSKKKKRSIESEPSGENSSNEILSSYNIFIPDMPFPPFSSDPEITFPTTLFRSLTLEEIQVREACQMFPIIKDPTIELPYLSTTESIYAKWTTGKRMAAERLRALHVKRFLQGKDPNFSLTTSNIFKLCRYTGLSPIVNNQNDLIPNEKDKDQAIESPRFCKYCGSHHQQSDFDHLQDRCRKRMKIPSSTNHLTNSCTHSLEETLSREDSHTPCNICLTSTTQRVVDFRDDVGIPELLNGCGFEIQDTGCEQLFNILFKKFASNLLSHSVSVYKEQATHETFKEKEGKVLVPYHVYQAITDCDQFDFLRNNLKTKGDQSNKRKRP